ncbi:hypothetical protein D0Y65_026195 [Glycine soja]|uniref:Uncharacterized protein n=1 Tax=Glycine soja TaxID=3848 RepID=A0A445IIS5_GLYSO|nr:hypothetical protein D0Y65_026195 [Glycine soja]
MRLVRVAGLACASVESRAWRVLLLDRTLGVCSALSLVFPLFSLQRFSFFSLSSMLPQICGGIVGIF